MIKTLIFMALCSASTFLAQVDITSLNWKELGLGIGGLVVAGFCVKILAEFAGKKIDLLIAAFDQGSQNLQRFMLQADLSYKEGLLHMKEMKEAMRDIADKFSQAQCIKK